MSEHLARVAVVTGAGRGIGRAIAQALARSGLRVVACARTAGEETVAGVPATGSIVARSCDVAEPDDVDAFFDGVLRELGRVDVLVCSHGIYQSGVGALELALEQYHRTMAVNARCTARSARPPRCAEAGAAAASRSCPPSTARPRRSAPSTTTHPRPR